MEQNQTSMTAVISAFARAYHVLCDQPRIFDDSLARDMITDEQYADISGHMAAGISFFNPEESHLYSDPSDALRWVMQHQIASPMLSRSRYAEDSLMDAVARGAAQYVILGAGYDTFAFRQPGAGIRVFEVDHPATQAAKQERVAALGWAIPPALSFVPVDFTRDDLGQALVGAGYDPQSPGFFSWLGVTFYLTRDQIVRTLQAIASIASLGSTVVFDYADEHQFDEDAPVRVRRTVALAQGVGEPMQSAMSDANLAAVLDEAGFYLREHLTPEAIEARYFAGRTDGYHAMEHGHYALADVRE